MKTFGALSVSYPFKHWPLRTRIHTFIHVSASALFADRVFGLTDEMLYM